MPSSSQDHKATVRQEFTQQAQNYAANPQIKNQDRLAALVQAVQPQAGARVLDVATGPGYVAAAFAEAGCEVIGLDLTPAPLALAEQLRDARGLTNLSFQQGDAEHLPFDAQSFDIAVSRYALHHSEEPQRILTEMARVCHSRGLVVIQDLITSEFPERAAYQNRFEQLRDTSHTRALPLSEFLRLFTELDLEVEQVITDYMLHPIETWMANAHTDAERAAQVRELVARDVRENLSGTRAFERDGELYFYQRLATMVARKIA